MRKNEIQAHGTSSAIFFSMFSLSSEQVKGTRKVQMENNEAWTIEYMNTSKENAYSLTITWGLQCHRKGTYKKK